MRYDVFILRSDFHKVACPKRFRLLSPKEYYAVTNGSYFDLVSAGIKPEYFKSVKQFRNIINQGYTPITYIGM